MAEFVELLQPARPVPLSALIRRSMQGKRTKGLFAITVDDGVGETVRALAELCRTKAWPATFYLPTDYIDTGNGMAFQWWRVLKPLLPRKRLQLKSTVIDLTAPRALEELSRNMELAWHSQRLESYLPTIMELAEIVACENGTAAAAMRPGAPITWAEVESLSKNPLLRFESHGMSHAAMSSLREDELEFEMRHSRDLVTEHTGRPCRHLAYPFGNLTSIGDRAPALARRFYDSATTMALGPVDSADPWMLPRIPLYPENSALFARLKILLKCTCIGRITPDRATA
jgi:peptidoglycan/xylan/chitin deacetylase (PgdA/CDA1 family)